MSKTAILLLVGGLACAGAKDHDLVRATYFRQAFVQYGFTPDKVRFNGLTHIYYMGPGVNFSTGEFTGNPETPDLIQLRGLCRTNGVKLIGTLLGNEPAFNALKIPATRAKLVNSLATWCRESRLDGIDIDFEHPYTYTDRSNLTTFMTELRTALGPRSQLSAAVSALSSEPSVGAGIVNEQLDRLNIMSYDHQGDHATMDAAINDLKVHQDAGILPTKLSLGVPFYGVKSGVQKSYAALVNTYRSLNNGADPLGSLNRIDGFYFNGTDLIRQKANFAFARNGGVFTWILDHDITNKPAISLYESMMTGAESGQATIEGFEYPMFGNPMDSYQTSNLKLMPTMSRTSGTYGAAATLSFSGSAWCNTWMRSRTMVPFSMAGTYSSISVDLRIPTGAKIGVCYLYLYDAQGRAIRRLVGGLSSFNGWQRVAFPRSATDWQLMNTAFDWSKVTGYMLLFDGANGSSTVQPWTTNIVIDSVSLTQPVTGARPIRLDRDADDDGVPDINLASGSSRWINRFSYSPRTSPTAVFQFSGQPSSAEWKAATHGDTRKIMRWSTPFSGEQGATSWLQPPAHSPVALPAEATLHMELNVQTSSSRGALFLDLLDATGKSARVTNSAIPNHKGLHVLDLRVDQFSGADFNRDQVVGWRIGLQGTDIASAPFDSVVDLTDLAWGRLPAGTAIPSLDQDSDGDGLADVAEDRNQNGVRDAGETDINFADTDGDGTDDGAEIATGTDPLSAASRFAVSMTAASHENGMTLTWPSRVGAQYQVETSDLLQGWLPFGDALTATSVSTSMDVPGRNSALPQRFFRVRLIE